MLILDLDDRALILGTLRLSGTASGLEIESEYAQLLTPRGGLARAGLPGMGQGNASSRAGSAGLRPPLALTAGVSSLERRAGHDVQRVERREIVQIPAEP